MGLYGGHDRCFGLGEGLLGSAVMYQLYADNPINSLLGDSVNNLLNSLTVLQVVYKITEIIQK